MLILFGTMTGNAEAAADQIAKAIKRAGREVTVANIEKFTPGELIARGETVLFSVSTWGDGEPPDEALKFWDALRAMDASAMNGVRYAVYALGDSSYDEFCAFGRKLDEELAGKGASRIATRAECDCDYEEFINSWTNEVLEASRDAVFAS